MYALKLIAFASVVVFAAANAGAQTNQWVVPYEKGLQAFDAARYAEAIEYLERAVSADPRASRHKYVEGVFRADYLPYFYLAIAYTKLGAIDKAQASLAKARTGAPPALAAQLSDVQRAIGAARPRIAASPTPARAPDRTAPAAVRETAQPPDSASNVIIVRGDAIVRRAPDVAVVTVAVETRAKSPRDAQRQNADAMSAVVKRAADSGIPRDALRTVGVRLDQEFDTVNNRRTPRDFVARNTLEITVADVSRAGEIADGAVQAGATAIDGIRFELKDRAAAQREALRLAVADARGRAEAAASGAGRSVDRILKVEEEGVDTAPPRPLMRTMATTAEMTFVTTAEPGLIEVRAGVTLTVAMR
jgi:uncharacterized protein YggE